MASLARLITWEDAVYVFTGYPVFYISPAGRIISGVSEGCSQGLKPDRLGQFNQWGNNRVLICRMENLDYYLGFFIRKTRPTRGVKFRVADPHPLWDLQKGTHNAKKYREALIKRANCEDECQPHRSH